MSVDSQRFKETVPSVNFLWSAPVQFALGTYFLYDLVGVSAFAGLSVLLLCVPVNLASAMYVVARYVLYIQLAAASFNP